MTNFRLILTTPKTKTSASQTYEFNNASGNIQRLEIQQKAEGNYLSHLTAQIFDPGFAIFNKLPDPAFSSVTVKLYLAQPGQNSTTNLAFEGLLDRTSIGFPAPDTLQLLALDKSIAMRRNARHKTFKGKHAVGIAVAVAGTYGFDLDIDSGISLSSLTVQSTNTAVAKNDGPFFSDWDRIKAALHNDGLYAFMYGNKIFIRQLSNVVYPLTFQNRTYPVRSGSFSLNHVGNHSTVKYEFGAGTTTGGTKQYDAKAPSPANSPVNPVGGPDASKASQAHTEVPADKQQVNRITLTKGRKDEGEITCDLLPDYNLWHIAKIKGWGARIDSDATSKDKDQLWRTIGVRHVLIPGDAGVEQTIISLKRGASTKAKQEAAALGFGG